ncbi:Ig-like domain-containing protein, partial [Pseudomonas sp. HY7a-MNA-CIBAN-0227]|uniref:Ig-like domain-containing protein n=1 Tax=Pseudomonas sp. HY7a-MNA-CIBAN-0227 TaxID=3140474 RepID=UPI0033249766
GEWTLTLKEPLTNDNLTLTTTVTSGEVTSEVSVPVEVAVDNTTPTDLVITPIDGSKVFGEITSITGTVTGAIGGKVTVSSNGNEIGTAIVGQDGQWKLVLDGENALESGTHNITATVTSKTGVDAAAEATNPDFTVRPPTPEAPTFDLTKLPQISNVGKPITGNAEKGDEIVILNQGKEIDRFTVTREDGTWTWSSESLPHGEHRITTKSVRNDIESQTSLPVTVNVDTNNNTPTVTLPASTKISSLRIFNADTNKIVSNTLNISSSKQSQSFDLQAAINRGWDLKPLEDGNYIVRVTSNHKEIYSLPFTVKSHTNNATPMLTGSVNSNNDSYAYAVIITDSEKKVIYEPKINKDGTWSWQPDSPLSNGKYTISSGYKGAAPVVRTFTVDTSTPTVAIDANVASLTTITGTTQDAKGGKVIIFNNDEEIGRADVGQDGAWSLTLAETLPNDNHSLTAQVTNKAGTVSDMSKATVVTVDSTTLEENVVEMLPTLLSAGEEPVLDLNSLKADPSATTDAAQTESGVKTLNLTFGDLLRHNDQPLFAEVEKPDNTNSAANDDNSSKDILTEASLEKDMADTAPSMESILYDALNTSSNGLQLIITQEEVSAIS